MQVENEIGGIIVSPDDSWRFEVTEFPQLLSALGEPVVTAFCRCFVHSDRLVALAELGAMSHKRHGQNSAAHERNLHVMFWFVVGTLFEMGNAIKRLRTALQRAGLLDVTSGAWQKLEEIELWQKREPMKAHLKDLRNKIGFHVDEPLVRKGLEQILAEGKRVIVARGDSRKFYTTHHTLGMDALLRGLEVPEDVLKAAIEVAAKHHASSWVVQALFQEVLEKAGGSFGSPRPA